MNKSPLGIGPGLIELLEETQESGTVSKAAAKMKMSYSKAWKILKEAENGCGHKLLESESGGSSGGVSVLTDYAQKLIKVFREIEEKTYTAANGALNQLQSQIE